MRALASLVALLVATAALVVPALAQNDDVQTGDGASQFEVGNHTFTAFVSRTEAGAPDDRFQPGETAYLIVRASQSPEVANVTYTANVSVEVTEGDARVNVTENATVSLGPWVGDEEPLPRAVVPVRVVEGAEAGEVAFSVEVSLAATNRTGENVTVETFNATVPLTFEVLGVGAPPTLPPGGPDWLLIGLVGLVVVVVAGAGYAVSQRRRRPKVKPRSQTLQRMEAERQMERLQRRAEADEEARAELQRMEQESRAQEAARSKSRELMILEAKRDDTVKSMDLLRRRREAGQLTELQFNKMMEKKQAQLDVIEADLRDMES